MSNLPKPQQVLLDARGRTIIERRGARKSSLATDAYHFLRTATWGRIVLLFAAIFATVNLLFAAILYAGHARIMNADGFLDDLWFSVQTFGTIGYGYLAPADALANVVVTIESFVAMLMVALITGMFFARFSTVTARVLFSRVALITTYDRKRVLMFRLANERSTAIVEATVRVYMTRDEKLEHGESIRRVHDLPIRRSTSPVFALSFIVVHEIDEKSPLFGVSPESLVATGTNILCTLTGIDDRLAATVHSRYAWNAADVTFDHRFVDLFKVDDQGKRYLDLTPIHDTVPIQ